MVYNFVESSRFFFSSAISGYDVKLLRPENPTKASVFEEYREKRHIIFTAETHNFPTGYVTFLYLLWIKVIHLWTKVLIFVH